MKSTFFIREADDRRRHRSPRCARRRMKFRIKEMLMKFGNPAWGAPTDKMAITIVLGERVE